MYLITFTGCAHHDGLYIPCADRPPMTRDCPHGEPRQNRVIQDRSCDECTADQLTLAYALEQREEELMRELLDSGGEEEEEKHDEAEAVEPEEKKKDEDEEKEKEEEEKN